MIPFEIVEPTTFREAVGLLDPDDPAVRPIAGGTALMLMMKSGVFRPTRLVSLRSVGNGCARIEARPDGGLNIGALATLSSLEDSAALRERAPVIVQTLRTLSNVRVRNVATVGGHLAHADPHMDLPPVLIALGARVSAIGPSGERAIPVEALFAGYYETVLARNELITELMVPSQDGTRAAYLKCTTRAADDWPALGVAVALELNGTAIRSAKIVVSAATQKPTRLAATEAGLLGESSDAALSRAGETAEDEVEVISDAHGSAAYKRRLVRVYVQRALREALSATPEKAAT